jgi:predicted signal transduction protein with EAL and GGDEF domain
MQVLWPKPSRSGLVAVSIVSLLHMTALVYLGVVLFGGHYVCPKMYHHGLYTWALIVFYFNISVICCVS